VWAKVYPETEDYDRVVLFWREPTDYASEDSSKIRVYTVDANTHLEVLEYVTRTFIDPADAIAITTPSYFRRYGVRLELAQTVSPSSTVVYIAGNTREIPSSGTGEFEDGTSFSYSGKTYDTLTGVVIGDRYHFYGEEIIVRW
jgi:hypothetical protein